MMTTPPDLSSSEGSDRPTSLPRAAATVTSAPEPTATSAKPTVASAPEPPADGGKTIRWEGLVITIPAKHVWRQSEPSDPVEIHGAPVLAGARIEFDPTFATHPVELPGGISFTIVRFSGPPEAWLAKAREHAATTKNPIEEGSIRHTQVAGRPAISYNHLVTGLGLSRHYIVALDHERLLLVYNSNVDGPYRQVMDWLALEEQ